ARSPGRPACSAPHSSVMPSALIRWPAISGARLEHGLDDGDVAGAAAEIAGEHLANALGVGVRLFAKQRMRGGQDAGRAEAALQGMMLAERGLQRPERRRVGAGKSLD